MPERRASAFAFVRGFARVSVARLCAALCASTLLSAAAAPLSTSSTDWVADKADPTTFGLLPLYQGKSDVWDITVGPQGYTSLPEHWQGRLTTRSPAPGYSVTYGSVYIPASWAGSTTADDRRQTGLWSLLSPGAPPAGYRSGITFSNAGGAGGFTAEYENRAEGNAIYAAGTSTTPTLLAGYVTNANQAVDGDIATYATMVVPLNLLGILPPSYLDASFTDAAPAGSRVGVTVSQSSTLLSLSLLSNLSITAYDASNNVVASKIGFVLTDLVPVANNSGKYTLSFQAPAGPYTISRVRLTMTGVLGVLESINVHNFYTQEIGDLAVSAVAPVYAGWNQLCQVLDTTAGTLRTYVNEQLLATDSAPATRGLAALYGVALNAADFAGATGYDAYWGTLGQGQLASLVSVGSSSYRALPGDAFAQPLVVEARDASGNPLPCVDISITAPSSGASATLSGTTVRTDASGRATISATANNVLGSYNVTFAVTGSGIAPLAIPLANGALDPTPVPLNPHGVWMAALVLLMLAARQRALRGAGR